MSAQKPILYSYMDHHYCHRIRLVLAEKEVDYQLVLVDALDTDEEDQPLVEDLMSLNPYGSAPFYIDRDIKLYHHSTLIEYLDDRYRHTRLLTDSIIDKAKIKQNIWRIEEDWFKRFDALLDQNNADMKKELYQILCSLNPIFAEYEFFLSKEFSILDCAILPILYRLHAIGLEINPQKHAHIQAYMTRLFQRVSFQKSLTALERVKYRPKKAP